MYQSKYLVCKKQYDCNEEYGIDLIVGKKYLCKSNVEDSHYISTENGSCLEMSNEELKEFFI